MNRIVKRYVAQGKWTADSAVHTGGEPDVLETAADMVVLRDSAGRFLIPGASIAGAARNWLARQTLSFEDYGRGVAGESLPMRAMFGSGTEVKASGFASLLTVHDGLLEGRGEVRLRDGVAINSELGIAEDGAKYDMQVLPAGVSFSFHIALAIFEELPFGLTEGDLLPYFRKMLRAFTEGGIRLGARTRRGFGRGRVNEGWSIWALEMTRSSHMKAWLSRKLNEGEVVPKGWLDVGDAMPAVEHSTYDLTIDAEFWLKTSALVRAAAEGSIADKRPDSIQLTENGQPIIPGTSLAGALRHRSERIASLVGAGAMVDQMFGVMNQSEPEKSHASRVWVEDAKLWNGAVEVQGRVSIDRFTGAAKDSALFEEGAFWPQNKTEHHTRVVIKLDRATQAEAGLLLLAFKDLWLGDLTLGGGAGGGRGVFRGHRAQIELHGGNRTETVKWESGEQESDQLRVTSGKPGFLNEAVRALRQGADNAKT